MNKIIKLLTTSLLDERKKLKELSYWLRVMNRPNGWHYDLDHIWILDELEKSGINKGSTIIDAGAGQGVMQYLLASRGYNVISLDFTSRNPPPRAHGIFTIIAEEKTEINYEHPYMKFISYGTDRSRSLLKKISIQKISKIFELPARCFRLVHSYFYYFYERYFRNHENFGVITYVRAPFHDVPLESNFADAIISVSAIEHADIDLFLENINSLTRLLKPAAPLLLTTSATSKMDNHYDYQVEGWCFSRSSLVTYFPECDLDFNVSECKQSFFKSKTFHQRLDPYYYKNPKSPFFMRKFNDLPYLPVSIKLIK
jgi:ubiquinone/menaquinone biosynthesis C-methylase UbiE